MPKVVGAADPAPALRLFRQDDTLCSMTASADWIADAGGASPSPLPGRFVARLVPVAGKKSPAAPQLKVDVNRPQIEGTMVVRLRRQDEAWWADVDFRVRVVQGVIDRLRIDFPAELAAPAEIRPAAPFDWQSIPATSRARLSLHFAASLSGAAAWQFTLPWKPAATGLLAPEFEPRDGLEIDRYLVVPTGYELQSQASATGRWEAAELPSELRLGTDGSTRAIRLVGSPPAAPLVRRAPQSGSPVVRLQDLRLAWSNDEDCVVSAWELEPEALRECVVQLPAGAELVRATIGGVPVAPRPLSAGNWQLPLGPRFLPQRLEVLYRTQRAGMTGPDPSRTFPAAILSIPDADGARLRELKVERTLWTIRGPREAGRGEAANADQELSEFRQSLARLQAASAMVAVPLESAGNYSSADLETWYLPWVRHWVSNQAGLRRQAGLENLPAAEQSRVDQLEGEQIALAARLSATGVRNQAVAEAHRFSDHASLWEATQSPDALPVRLSLRGGAREARVDYPRLAPRSYSPGLLLGLTAIALGLLGAVAVQTRLVIQCFSRWPAATGIFLGLAIWWLGGPLGWIGWVLALLALAWSLRVAWLGERRGA